jgi:RNA polymerase-binding transcription factor
MTRTTTAALVSKAKTPDSRHEELRQVLEERRQELVTALHDKIRRVRADHEANLGRGGLDEVETSDADVQGDIELALIQMRAETLGRIDEAIARLEAGLYGNCFACGEEIARSRLRALPFAVRCRDCEELDETERQRVRTAQRRGSAPFMDAIGFRDPALS